jgi:SNF2 family DNA or RNA helicase
MPQACLHAELSADGASVVLIGTGTDAQIQHMAHWLQLATPLIKPSNPPGALTLPATWAGVVQLSHMFGSMWRPGPRLTTWLAEQLTLRTRTGGELSVALPEGLTPRPYQVDGALMIAALGRALIFDDPGTGKTITTILGLVERAAAGHQVAPVVVIAPASVVDPWVQAWQTWAPGWHVATWRGTPERRKRLISAGAHVLVTSYDTARMDAANKDGPLARLGARSVVIDECHLIKTAHAVRSLATRRLARKADNVIALSGTPITHHPGDLWPALEAVEPRAWPSGERWKARYCVTVPGDYAVKVLGLQPNTEPELRTALLGQHRRVAKADVLTQLPPKVYSVRQVELPPAWRKAYDAMEHQMLA